MKTFTYVWIAGLCQTYTNMIKQTFVPQTELSFMHFFQMGPANNFMPFFLIHWFENVKMKQKHVQYILIL